MPRGIDTAFHPGRKVHRGRWDPQNAPDIDSDMDYDEDYEPDYEAIHERRAEARAERIQDYYDRKY